MQAISKITEDLMRMKTTADRLYELQRAVQYVCDYFADLGDGVVVRRYESGGKPSVVIGFNDSLEPDSLLVGHLDVVPADDDFFEPRREGEVLRGRGSCDMKSEVAVMMLLMREYALLAREQRPPVALMLSCDEEIGGAHGVGYLVNTIGYRCRVALVPDGGESPDKIILKSKGVLHITAHARGRAAHGSRPWQGENAIEKLIAAYEKIHAMFPTIDDPDHWHSTCVIGKFNGGMMVNQVPDSASCEIDIRFVDDMQPQALLERVRECVAGDVDVQLMSCARGVATPLYEPHIAAYSAAVMNTLDTELSEEITHGATDGRFFSELGIPVIISRPVSGGQHTPEEWVDMVSLEKFMRLYRDAIDRFGRMRVGE